MTVSTELLAQLLHGRRHEVLRATVLADSATLGGRSGAETTLVSVECTDRTFPLVVKTVSSHLDPEPDLLQHLYEHGAPVAEYLGRVRHPDGSVSFGVEYLPHAVDWPIPASYHLSWARSAAKLAAAPLPLHVALPRLEWRRRIVEFIAILRDAIGFQDDVLQAELAHRDLRDPKEIVSGMDALLTVGDQLPTGLAHGELYVHHTGQRESDGEVLFFDFGLACLCPRLWDLVAITIDHGEPYEADVTDLRRAYVENHPGLDGDLDDELQITRALTSLIRIPMMLPWLRRLIQTGEDSGEFTTSPRKWIVLHLEALRDGIRVQA